MNITRIKQDARQFMTKMKRMSLAFDGVYAQAKDSEYDVETGKEVISLTEMTLTVFMTGFKSRELVDGIRATDMRGRVLLESLDEENMVPEIDDTITVDDVVWRVVSLSRSPISGFVVFQLRTA